MFASVTPVRVTDVLFSALAIVLLTGLLGKAETCGLGTERSGQRQQSETGSFGGVLLPVAERSQCGLVDG